MKPKREIIYFTFLKAAMFILETLAYTANSMETLKYPRNFLNFTTVLVY